MADVRAATRFTIPEGIIQLIEETDAARPPAAPGRLFSRQHSRRAPRSAAGASASEAGSRRAEAATVQSHSEAVVREVGGRRVVFVDHHHAHHHHHFHSRDAWGGPGFGMPEALQRARERWAETAAEERLQGAAAASSTAEAELGGPCAAASAGSRGRLLGGSRGASAATFASAGSSRGGGRSAVAKPQRPASLWPGAVADTNFSAEALVCRDPTTEETLLAALTASSASLADAEADASASGASLVAALKVPRSRLSADGDLGVTASKLTSEEQPMPLDEYFGLFAQLSPQRRLKFSPYSAPLSARGRSRGPLQAP
eukprot:TRINITY_DN20223_c0_g4_i1.p1 TRINITY_DN20223_c0_g4~~TRINITY_DN20223_c0_g4_i1.p1  ORF type:complete len:316 (+),score=69.84 TRINITY_DN20223_c0_g4_i1:42-989(+)